MHYRSNMIKRLIIFLIRKRLGVRLYETFVFANQKSDSVYWFTPDCIMKRGIAGITLSGVSLNWLLDKECTIEPVDI